MGKTAILAAASGYTPEQVKEVFTLRGNAPANVRRTKSGVEYTVGDN